ncbi:helix-turn-helix domain-containing protein [Kitasatospora sp. NPDC051984]|uniref:helix-turn-helix domain-containing protein n=1 Tax=Kitasatospora sp. NPDC051984 TaxID=3364059 RepID=UPI0037C63F9A
MPEEPNPWRKRLGAEVRHRRVELKWNLDTAAKQLGYGSASTAHKIESGHQRITLQQLPHFLDVLKVTEPAAREFWRVLVVSAASDDFGERFPGAAGGPFGSYYTDIELARSAFLWSPTAPHGLLQCPLVERAIIEAGRGWSTPADIDRFVGMRAELRERVLSRQPPPTITSVLTEGQLRQEIGGRIGVRQQAEHLAGLARTVPEIKVLVLPFAAGAHPGIDGPFMLMEFPTGRGSVTIEGRRAALHIHEADVVAEYKSVSKQMMDGALSPEDSLTFLDRLAEEYDE